MPHSQRGLARCVFGAALVSGPVWEEAARSTPGLTGPRTPARWGLVSRCHSARDRKEGNGLLRFLKRENKNGLSFAMGFGVHCQDQRVGGSHWLLRGRLCRTCPDRLCPRVEPAAWPTSRANDSFYYSTLLFPKVGFFCSFAVAFRAWVLHDAISFLFF